MLRTMTCDEFNYVKASNQLKGIRIVGGKILVLYYLDGRVEKIKCESMEEAENRYCEILSEMKWN